MREATAIRRTVLAALIGLLGIGGLYATVVQQAPAPMVKSMPAERAMPPTILITKETPDTAFLCAELPDQQAACRPVYEARKWLRERPRPAK